MGNKENIFPIYGRVICHYETAIVHSFSKSNHHHTIITVTLSLLGNIWLLLFNELLVPCVEISYRFGPICTYVFTNLFLLNFSISFFFSFFIPCEVKGCVCYFWTYNSILCFTSLYCSCLAYFKTRNNQGKHSFEKQNFC